MARSKERQEGMGERWKRWFQKKGLEKWTKRDNLVILVLAGILLFIIALPTKSAKPSGEGQGGGAESPALFGNFYGSGKNAGVGAAAGAGSDAGAAASYEGFREEDYVKQLEAELADVLASIRDVGAVRVMITLHGSPATVVGKDGERQYSQTDEKDSAGGSRSIAQSQTRESTLYLTQGGSSSPYVVQTLSPRVRGVAVVAQGAGKGRMDKEITEIVQALFGLEAHQVKVVPMRQLDAQ